MTNPFNLIIGGIVVLILIIRFLLPKIIVMCRPVGRVGRLTVKGHQALQEGRLEQAGQFFQAALALAERTIVGEETVGQCLNDLGMLAAQRGQFREALGWYEQAFARVTGAGLPPAKQLWFRAELGDMYWMFGRWSDAERILAECRQVDPGTDAHQSVHHLSALYTLARVYRGTGRFAEAESLLHWVDVALVDSTALPLYKKHLLAKCRLEQALIEMLRKNLDQAESLLALAEHAMMAGLVENKRGMLSVWRFQAMRAELQERYGDAEQLLIRARSAVEQLYGPGHPYRAMILTALAKVQVKAGRLPEAQALLEAARPVLIEAFGEDGIEIAGLLAGEAALHQAQDRLPEAEACLLRARIIAEQAGGPRCTMLTGMLPALAKLYAAQGRDEEANTTYSAALTLSSEVLGDCPYTRELAERLPA